MIVSQSTKHTTFMDINGTACNFIQKMGGHMRIEQLRYLVETADAASINKASERLFITQQSLNTSIKKMEQELGVELFYRHSQGVSLTEQGEIVLAYAKDVLDKTEKLKAALNPESVGRADILAGCLELSACAALSHWVLPLILGKLQKDHKDVSVSLLECENLDMIRSLVNNEQRLYLMNVYSGHDREFEMLNLNKLFYKEICECKTYAIVSNQHPLAKQKSVSVRSLHKYPLAIFQAAEKTSSAVMDHMQSYGKMQIAIKTNNFNVYQDYIDSGDVVGFIPRFSNRIVVHPREGTVLIPIHDFPKTRIICLADQQYYNKQKKIVNTFLGYICD